MSGLHRTYVSVTDAGAARKGTCDPRGDEAPRARWGPVLYLGVDQGRVRGPSFDIRALPATSGCYRCQAEDCAYSESQRAAVFSDLCAQFLSKLKEKKSYEQLGAVGSVAPLLLCVD